MNRRAQREELQSTWYVTREPTKGGPSRKQRRANLAEARREARKRVPVWEAFHQPTEEAEQVPMSQ